jgi:hypothetical protein
MQVLVSNRTLELGDADRDFDDPVGRAEELAAIYGLLPEDDRRLADLLFLRHQSHRAAAAALGVDAGAISRRARRLRNRLACPTLRMVARALHTLDPLPRQIAVDHFFAATSVNEIARERGLTRRQAQSQLDFVRGWAKALHRAALRLAGADDEDERPSSF